MRRDGELGNEDRVLTSKGKTRLLKCAKAQELVCYHCLRKIRLGSRIHVKWTTPFRGKNQFDVEKAKVPKIYH